MATQAVKKAPILVQPQPVEAAHTNVARQPILDQWGRIHGYELFFRNGTDSRFRGNRDFATRSVLDNALVVGLDKLTGGQPAFLNCTPESITQKLVEVLQPAQTVLELPEVSPTEELIDTCKSLKKSGFRLAACSVCWLPECEPLVELTDFLKVDFTQLTIASRDLLRRNMENPSLTLIAERIESQDDFIRAQAEGFTLFQGYYFCQPQIVKSRQIPNNWLSRVKILEYMHRGQRNMAELAELVKRDTALTYRLMRIANSPIYGVRREITSVELALVIIGEEMFRRIAILAITNELNSSGSPQILRTALVRARFCELAAELFGGDATEQYLLGMLSLLPAMLGAQMSELVPTLPLRPPIRAALAGEHIQERRVLGWLELWERADWEGSDEFAEEWKLDPKWLARTYQDAVFWADSAGHFSD